MKVCDSHVHVGEFYDRVNRSVQHYTPRELVSQMAAAGVDLAIVSHIGAIAEPIEANREMTRIAAEYPQLAPLVWVSPDVMSPDDVLDLLDLGFKGLKFHPTAGQYRADSPALNPYLDLCLNTRTAALFHSASDEYSAPAFFDAVALAHPCVPIVLAHMNLMGPAGEAIEAAEAHPNLYLDTSWAAPEDILEAISRLGAGRVLWGTDAPLGGASHYAQDRGRPIIEQRLTQAEREAVLWGNAERLFRL
ncbi:MAG: amidohydrolase family protein [Clostridia bacterium]|nr:amidohydrolase family protein [Clostridia bacterium]